MPHLTGCPVDYLAPTIACPACGQGTPDLSRSSSWDTPGRTWTSEPAVAWGDERPPEEDGTPRQRPIRFTFDGGATSYTDGGLTFLGVWRQEIDEDGNLGEVKEE